MIEDLYELIGGRSTIEAASERFYDKMMHDESFCAISLSKRTWHTSGRGRQCCCFHAAGREGVYREKYS